MSRSLYIFIIGLLQVLTLAVLSEKVFLLLLIYVIKRSKPDQSINPLMSL